MADAQFRIFDLRRSNPPRRGCWLGSVVLCGERRLPAFPAWVHQPVPRLAVRLFRSVFLLRLVVLHLLRRLTGPRTALLALRAWLPPRNWLTIAVDPSTVVFLHLPTPVSNSSVMTACKPVSRPLPGHCGRRFVFGRPLPWSGLFLALQRLPLPCPRRSVARPAPLPAHPDPSRWICSRPL
jgi:hypothetical protein